MFFRRVGRNFISKWLMSRRFMKVLGSWLLSEFFVFELIYMLVGEEVGVGY